MKRKLIAQMRNEWRSNIWMIIELVIVLTVLQSLFTVLYFIYDLHKPIKGIDLENVYVANVDGLRNDSPEFTPYDSLHNFFTDRQMLVAQLKENPYVEEVGLGSNLEPYNYNYWGTNVVPLEGADGKGYRANVRTVDAGAVRAIRLTGLHGETTEQLAQIIENGDLILSNLPEDDTVNIDPETLAGKEVFWDSDTAKVKTVKALAWGMARSDFEPLREGVAYVPLNPQDWAQKMVIRLKPGTESAFLESLKPTDLQLGNVFITNLTSIDSLRKAAHSDIMTTIRNLTICALFMLLVIFLGFLGTFWFRTQQRAGEIAIRKVTGATNRNVFARFIGEGMLLLLVSAVIAIPLYGWLTKTEYFKEIFFNLGSVEYAVAGCIIAIIAVALLIVLGIWLPARKAVKANPVFALKDQ